MHRDILLSVNGGKAIRTMNKSHIRDLQPSLRIPAARQFAQDMIV